MFRVISKAMNISHLFKDMFEVCVVTLRINVTRYRLESVTYTGFKALYLFSEEV